MPGQVFISAAILKEAIRQLPELPKDGEPICKIEVPQCDRDASGRLVYRGKKTILTFEYHYGFKEWILEL